MVSGTNIKLSFMGLNHANLRDDEKSVQKPGLPMVS